MSSNELSFLLNKARLALQKMYGSRLSKIILFGSYARSEQSENSDIDLLVILNDEKISHGREIRFMNSSLFKIGFDNNISISAHPVSAGRFETEPSFFFNRIKKEGREL